MADARTGLLAVGLCSPARLALLDARGRVVARIPLPGAPRHLALAAPGGPVLVPAEHARRLVEVSLTTRRVLRSTPVGPFPHDATAAAGRVFVSDELGGTVSVVRGGRRVRTLRGWVQPAGAATVDGRVAIADVRRNDVTLIAPRSLRRLGSLAVGAGLTHAAADAAGRLVLVDTRGGALWILRVRPRLRVVRRISLPGRPYAVAVDARRDELWVALGARNLLAGFALAARGDTPFALLPTVRQPNSVAVDSRTGTVFVAGRTAGVVQIIAHPVRSR